MLSVPDMMVLGAAALLFFGPEQLPRVARKAGNVMREIQNTSQSFIRELERAADVEDAKDAKPYEPTPYDTAPYDAAYDTAHYEPPAPEPDAPDSGAPGSDAGEKLAEPSPALDLRPSEAAQTPPQPDHAPHL
jgi:Sec-independent protein translocase protein TatA